MVSNYRRYDFQEYLRNRSNELENQKDGPVQNYSIYSLV